MKKVLVTGSCGFIFSNFMRVNICGYEFIGVDKVISKCNAFNMSDNYRLYIGDIADEHFMNVVFRKEKPDIVIHGAAESFVDDSIRKALPFVHSNVLGTQICVDMALDYGVERFLYVSTDEVYGQLKVGDSAWKETTPVNPRNPYSASKASGEMIVKAAHQTHGLQYNITRSCNNYGPRQPPRNLVPKVISCVLANEKIPIHGQGKQFREWIFVNDHCSAIMKVLSHGEPNETYNVGTGVELANLDMVHRICKILGRGDGLVSFIKDRPGHDFRYSVDCRKLLKLGWRPSVDFAQGLETCVKWYLDTPGYLDFIRD